jgi:glyoxylate carboligase
VDMSPAEIDENYRTLAEVVGDIGSSLDALTEATKGMKAPDASLYSKERAAMAHDFSEHAQDQGFPVKPQRILSDVREFLDDRDIVLSDVGAHKMWIARYLQSEEPNTVLISNGFCTMGFALPGAIGAKLAYPDRRVLAICGDGGVMMNIQDLETAVREKQNIVVMVWTDSAYGLIRWKQQAQFGKHTATAFTNPDWMKLAEAFGMAGFKVTKAADLPGALEGAFSAGKPALIEVPVDYSENMKLTGRLKAIPFEDLCDALGKVSLFKGIPVHYRRTIAEAMDERGWKKGETGDQVFVVQSGAASVQHAGKEVARVEAGGAFGEMAALSTAPRSATVVAAEDMVCGTLSGEEFRNMLRAEPELSLELAKVFAKRAAER